MDMNQIPQLHFPQKHSAAKTEIFSSEEQVQVQVLFVDQFVAVYCMWQ
jgi:hypothetical protein